jgi:hypothetical protein
MERETIKVNMRPTDEEREESRPLPYFPDESCERCGALGAYEIDNLLLCAKCLQVVCLGYEDEHGQYLY